MAKAKTVYTCESCGGQQPKWQLGIATALRQRVQPRADGEAVATDEAVERVELAQVLESQALHQGWRTQCEPLPHGFVAAVLEVLRQRLVAAWARGRPGVLEADTKAEPIATVVVERGQETTSQRRPVGDRFDRLFFERFECRSQELLQRQTKRGRRTRSEHAALLEHRRGQ